MREQLEKIEDLRTKFTAVFARFGEKSSYRGPPKKTVLLTYVRNYRGDLLTDHVWLNLTAQLAAANLHPGDLIEFHARVKEYRKGYLGRLEELDLPPPSYDYGLKWPTRIRKLTVSKDQAQIETFAGAV
jgi:hypothetical protein